MGSQARKQQVRCAIAVALLATVLFGCGENGSAVLDTPTGGTPSPGAQELTPDPQPQPTGATTPKASPSTDTTTPAHPEPSPTAATARIITDEWEQVPSLDGSPPAHPSDIQRAIDAALADPDFDGWLDWFEEITVTHIRTRGDGVLVRVELDPLLDPAVPEHRRHNYPTAVCFVGRDSDVVTSVVWLVDPGEGRVLASTPVWADGTSCHLW